MKTNNGSVLKQMINKMLIYWKMDTPKATITMIGSYPHENQKKIFNFHRDKTLYIHCTILLKKIKCLICGFFVTIQKTLRK
ncbi:hypothetical protein MAQA_03566 [Listeria aquatica FSL S10-1188]|uniref:Uncharacterized protein n=1 Tax=Listeria aquatica FSL S10-1188 TaxID=1265818 RepID=W7B7T8_9LIST|nr:hypothetical protein MAQA_03566 [Listeria aquatica FSL S10-1188]